MIILYEVCCASKHLIIVRVYQSQGGQSGGHHPLRQQGRGHLQAPPLSRYTIREVKAPANYGVSDQELTAYLEHAGEIVRFEVTNKALSPGVSITKTGPKQAMAGQPVNYTFSSIGNNSNVMLMSFYWRERALFLDNLRKNTQ